MNCMLILYLFTLFFYFSHSEQVKDKKFTESNYYDLLGIPTTANTSEISNKCRELIKINANQINKHKILQGIIIFSNIACAILLSEKDKQIYDSIKDLTLPEDVIILIITIISILGFLGILGLLCGLVCFMFVVVVFAFLDS